MHEFVFISVSRNCSVKNLIAVSRNCSVKKFRLYSIQKAAEALRGDTAHTRPPTAGAIGQGEPASESSCEPSYQDLLKSLNLYNQEIVNRHELQTMINDILGRTPDLIHGFNEFLERCESMDLDLGDMVRGKDGKLSLKDMAKVKDAMGRRLQQVISNREKFHTRPISELDLSDCERCGPSYRLAGRRRRYETWNAPRSAASTRRHGAPPGPVFRFSPSLYSAVT